MNNFVIASVIIILIVIFTFFNSIYICCLCDDMTRLIDKGEIYQAKTLWNEKKGYLSFFVRDGEIDSVNAEVEALGSDIRPEDEEEIVLRFRRAIGEIKDSEDILSGNIF